MLVHWPSIETALGEYLMLTVCGVSLYNPVDSSWAKQFAWPFRPFNPLAKCFPTNTTTGYDFGIMNTFGVIIPASGMANTINPTGETNIGPWSNAGLRLGRRRRGWPNLNPALADRLVFLGLNLHPRL